MKEFEEALQECEFLDNPDSGIPIPVLTYYTTKFNHEMKQKVSRIVSIIFYYFLENLVEGLKSNWTLMSGCLQAVIFYFIEIKDKIK